MLATDPAIDTLIDAALAEDVGAGDLTTDAIVPARLRATADVMLKSPGVVCGLDLMLAVLRRLDPDADLEVLVDEGTPVDAVPLVIARIHASARALLTGERTALNIVQRLSGIATAARRYADALAGTGVELLDTRKTGPGLRALDKRAAACGGAANHRFGLYDAILIKDNHVQIAGGVAAAVAAARRSHPARAIEVEVDTLDQLDAALEAGAETILLDNMSLDQLTAAVQRTAGRARLEASGGITLQTVRAIAETGVDAVSVGALTHSVTALDISLEVQPWQP